jgi:urea carboxylase system permease
MSTEQLSEDDRLLATFGYKQELTRTLGSFSTFATGFAFISILTGMFLLFGFSYGVGGPASVWAWVIAVVGQMLFALSFAELAVRFPLAGSVYNWTKRIAGKGVSWMAGVSMMLGLIVSTAAVALTMGVLLPQISPAFQFYGTSSNPVDVSVNAVIIGSLTLVLTTVVSVLGTRVRSIVNNIGVMVELGASVILIVGFLFHAKRTPLVAFDTNGTSSGSSGYVGSLLVCLLLGLVVLWGFDTAGSLGEETINPRKTSPRAIIRAVIASGVFGFLLILTAVMAVPDLKDPRIASQGLAFVVKTAFGSTYGTLLLVAAAVAVFVCALANQTGAVNMMFAMARDNALPGSSRLANVAARAKTPVVPPIVVAVVGILILLVNISQPQIILVVTSDTVIFALVSYILVAGSFSFARIRGQWPAPAKGYFTLGRWGLVVSAVASVWAIAMVVNIAWPRNVVYNPAPPYAWYLQWGGVLIPAVVLAIAFAIYFTQRNKIGILAAHASIPEDGSVAAPEALGHGGL